MNYWTAEIVYLLNLAFTVTYASAMFMYLGRHDTRLGTTKALQRFLTGIISWAFYDLIMIRIGQMLEPETAFFLFRLLCFMWLAIGGLGGELIMSLVRPVTWRLRVILFAPFVIMYLVQLFFPSLTTGMVYGIPGGWGAFPGPWQTAYTILWTTFSLILGVILFWSARNEHDPKARKEKYILLSGMILTLTVLAVTRKMLESQPGFPALGNMSMSIYALAAFIGLSRYGRVLSTRTLYQVTVDNIPSGLAHIYKGKITWANQALALMAGAGESAGVIGQDISNFLLLLAPGNILDLFSGDRTVAAEVGFRGLSDSLFLATTVPMDPKDPDQGNLLVLTDITEREKVAEERERRAKLEGVMEMAETASHELNQPLQVIYGQAELLLHYHPGEDKILARLKSIIAQIERLTELTGKIQRITKYETTDHLGRIKIIDLDKSSAN